MNAMQSKVNAAQSLDELCNILNSFVPANGERLEDVVDLPGLPTFGGTMPLDTREIWSWDATSLLGYDDGVYYVYPR